MIVSKFDHLRDVIPKSEFLSWSDFLSRYSHHIVAKSKDSVPLISPAEWKAGSERKKAHVVRVHFAALDLDGVSEESVLKLRALLEPYDFLLCTTWSHPEQYAQNGLWYLRLFLPFSRPVEANEWRLFWTRLNEFCGGVLDSHCSDSSRIYFVPSAPVSSPLNQIIISRGKVLDVDAILQSQASGIGKAELLKLVGVLKQKNTEHAKLMAETLSKICAGESFAEPGNRDAILFKVTGVLAEKWPKVNPEALAIHFKASLAKMQSIASEAPTLDDVVKKLSRHQENQGEEVRSVLKQRIRNAFGGKRDTPYTPEELRGFAKDQGISEEDFANRWIIQHGQSFYVFKNGRYKKPVGLRELVNTAYKDLAPAISAGVNVFRITPKGGAIKKTADELVQEYGTVVESAKASFTLQQSRYDWDTETFEEAVCPLRDLKPEHSPIVAEYFRLLGGKNHEKLLDWVSVITELDKPCAALFLHGVPGSGKTLLAEGVTRLWSLGEPTELNQALGSQFNEGLTNCPLVLADEQLPSFIKREGSTAELRSFIQARNRTLNRKFKSSLTLHGAIRLIITANNRNLFHTGEALTNNDIEAVKGRILYFYIEQASKDYLNSLNETEKASLVAGDGIAKHALWLRDNHQIKERDPRFLVSGTDSAFHHSLMTGTGIRSEVCCWLISFLQDPNKLHNDKETLIRVSQGSLLVHARALIIFWKTYQTNVSPPAASAISSALSDLSEGRKQLKDGRGRPTYYRKIRTELLLAWNLENGYATEEEIISALSKNNQGEN